MAVESPAPPVGVWYTYVVRCVKGEREVVTERGGMDVEYREKRE
jgi:hypothetical protein